MINSQNYTNFKLITTSIILVYYKSLHNFKNHIRETKFSFFRFKNYLYYFYKTINKILKKYNIKLSIIKTNSILFLLLDNHKHISKLFNKFNTIYFNCIDEIKEQKGGFIFKEFDSVFTKILNVVDIVIDFLTIIPNHILFNSPILAPWQLMSLISNLMRGDYMLAFFSFITIIPDVGLVVGASLKIIYKIVSFIIEKIYVAKQDIYLQDIESMRRIYKLNEFNPLHNYTPYESLNSIENEELII
jgi:hypothetical protein